MLKVSWLHRVLHINPGLLPRWVCSYNRCGAGVNAFSALGSLMIVAAIILFRISLVAALALVALSALYGWFVVLPFEACESSARARRRRNECINCGRPLQQECSGSRGTCYECARAHGKSTQ
jgi:hypothetical protein